MKKKTANLYIDGYNFYYSVTKAAKEPEKYRDEIDEEMCIGYAWCNFKKLAEEQLLLPDEQLDRIVYCTAKVKKNKKKNQETYPGEKKKQKLWLDCLEKYIPDIEIIHGVHQLDINKEKKIREHLKQIKRDTNASQVIKILLDKILNLMEPKRKEKMTDVNIAVEMVIDGLCSKKNIDVAILITEDADILPAVKALCKERKELDAKPIDVRVYIPIPKKKNLWDNLKKDYKLTRLTTDKLTADRLAKSVLPYPQGDSRASFKRDKKMLDMTVREEIYKKNPCNRYWTYDAIKKSVNEVQRICVVDDIVCNVTADEKEILEKSSSPGWKRFKENGISVYDYLKGTYKT